MEVSSLVVSHLICQPVVVRCLNRINGLLSAGVQSIGKDNNHCLSPTPSIFRLHVRTQADNDDDDCLFVGCLTSQQQASVSQGRICTDNFTCCHTEIRIQVADPTFYLTQSQYTDTGPTSPSADPITPGAWQGSHWSANF